MSKRTIRGTAMTFQQKEKFMERLVDFALAAGKLMDAWEDGSEFCEGYPFGESFDETYDKIAAWQQRCVAALQAAQLKAEQTPAVVILDTTQMDGEFENDLRERGITHKVLAKIWNGWSVEYRGSRLALGKLVADWWADEDGTMGEQEKIQDVEGAQQ